jgi:hypothetical protein
VPDQFPEPRRQLKDGEVWLIGTDDAVGWINEGVREGRSIAAAIPPVFASYTTLTPPLEPLSDEAARRVQDDRFDDAVLRVLCSHTDRQPWWLGFLDTGASDVVLDDAPRVLVYYGWRYVLVQAGPRQARTWRSDRRWFTALPELMFPADRSWLLSSLWDDAWACVGGSEHLIAALLNDADLTDCAQRTDPSVSDMWPQALPDWMHDQLKR